ncbi:UDP-2,4-diacetamido-2,4,6-trideoxy-beta-L-altropyranose hydrolase [Hymenobacter sp. ASUV-10]|uniref:UDP-2,4-diacetamido-2,4, 6-trideoxy-beta-L-altropyranose hydrolase n=1 Tax=Hymenobacter aranciens TaxID=3063996 RepID=A0ABT9BFL1_9BACT|nr:UDP-2,4-diacetamido-2,4,6-trideoxy-beta-L-altropyranose hydrolase [Hymenobacter sp. ASUV-10]MDO7876443.1 UDP-2,4-diacetamido-2,4,6-trideoxy-beta-L-altropyranose hydrolase [Hymenobacter sp. ASUV-10]
MPVTAALLPRLVLRADGNSRIGLGHVMRLLALADIVRDAFATVIFATRDASLAPLLTEAGVEFVLIPELLPQTEASWLRTRVLQATDVLIADGYAFDADYQQELRRGAGRLVYVDDLRAWPVVADVLINHSPGIMPGMYDLTRPGAQLLLGPAYSLLRPAFRAAAAPPRPPHPIRKLLLCFGGADPLHLTARCLRLLLHEPALEEIGLLAGPANPDSSALQQLVKQANGRAILHPPAGAQELVTLLRNYDAVVCPSSTILIEALVLGTAALTGYYVENQHHLADFVHAHQQAYSVGHFAVLDDAALLTRLRAGLHFLAHTPRPPYAPPLRTVELRAAIAAPLPASDG